MKFYNLVYLFLTISCMVNEISLEVVVPPIVSTTTTAFLHCGFLNDGSIEFYSLQWYINGQEFYRFLPWRENPINIYPVPYFTTLNSSYDGTVFINNITAPLKASLECLITGEAPYFKPYLFKKILNSFNYL